MVTGVDGGWLGEATRSSRVWTAHLAARAGRVAVPAKAAASSGRFSLPTSNSE
jgi:hypothetical protein